MSEERLIQIIKIFEKAKDEYKELSRVLNNALAETSVNKHFQDPDTGCVYEIVEPTGTFVEYYRIGYKRTKLPDEVKGSLSIKKAKELGYDV